MIYGYTDARAIDFTDPLNPLTSAGFAEHVKQAFYGDLQQDPVFVALRQSLNYTLRIQAVPDGANYLIAPRASFEQQFSVHPGSFLVGFSGSSSQAAGVKVQIKDLATAKNLFSQPVALNNLTGGPGTISTNPVVYLPKPLPIPSGFMAAQMWNQAAVANKIQLCLWIFEPIDPAQPPMKLAQGPTLHGLPTPATDADSILLGDMAAYQLARRGTDTSTTTPATHTTDYLVMPANGKPIFLLRTIFAPPPSAIASGDISVIEYTVPPGTAASFTAVSCTYDGPGFINGSGDLLWRISVDGAFAVGFDNITSPIGRDGQFVSLAGPIQAGPGQTIRFVAAVAANVALGGTITCGLHGFDYPTS